MAEIRHACEDGLTPACFAKYPQFAKKVFAYRLMHTMCPARMTTKLREALWNALIRVPVSWIPFEYFTFPEDFDWSLIFPEGWMPGDELPVGVIVDPDAEFPEGWTPGDPLPDGVTIDPGLFLPPYWETADPLPFGITVDPEYRIQIPQLKLMYIFIRPGETWESVFPNGWDPTGPLPDGASWNPYLVFPGWSPTGDPSVAPLTPEQEAAASAGLYGTDPPLYMGPWTPGPVHRVSEAGGVVVEEATILAENDCQIKNYQTLWEDTRDGGTGTGIFCSVGISSGNVQAWRGATASQIRRYFFSVDLSSIPAGATITAVTLQITGYGANVCGVSVQEGTQADIMTAADFGALTGECFAEIDWTPDVNLFSFNAEGIAYIQSQIGSTGKVCVREYDHDYLDVLPAVNDNFVAGMYGTTADTDAKKPQFIITYES